MNRSVLANIESGRRPDLTVSELLAFALALNVAPQTCSSLMTARTGPSAHLP